MLHPGDLALLVGRTSNFRFGEHRLRMIDVYAGADARRS